MRTRQRSLQLLFLALVTGGSAVAHSACKSNNIASTNDNNVIADTGVVPAGECSISGTLHDAGAANPSDGCQVCQPGVSATTWSNVADGTSCGNGGICHTGMCVAACEIAGVYYPPGVNPSNACQTCEPGVSTSAWTTTADASGCIVDACADDACTVTCTGTQTVCEGKCVDLASASTDCGSCGHDCGGGQCMSRACQPTTLLGGLGAVNGFAIDPTSVYVSAGGTLSSCPLAGCTSATPLVALVGLKFAATANGSVAFVGNDPTIMSVMENPTALFACPGADCPAPPLSRITGGYPGGGNFGFNELIGFGSDIYYQLNLPAAFYGHGVARCANVSGTTCTSLGVIVPNGLPPLAADATNVYFFFADDAGLSDLSSCPITGCSTPTPITSFVNPPSAITAFGGNLYYVTTYAVPLGGGPVFTCPNTGCTRGTAFGTLPMDTIVDITSDAAGVYFTGASTVYMCPLAGCPASGPIPIATGQPGPTFVRTDANFVYWVNTGAADAGTNGASIARVAK